MSKKVRSLLDEFERLTKKEQQQLAGEIIRRMDLDWTDEDLVQCAEELFLELDRREATDARPRTRRSEAR